MTFSMDNRLQTILFRAGWTAICLLAFLGVQAQTTPQFYNSSSGTSYNSFPLNSATNQVQWIYGPGEFNSTGPTGTPAYYGLITKVYFRLGTTAGATTYTNFSISLGQNVGTQSTWGTSSGSGYAFTTGLTPVFTQASYTMSGACRKYGNFRDKGALTVRIGQ